MARRYYVYREPTAAERLQYEVGFMGGSLLFSRFGCLRVLVMPIAFLLWTSALTAIYYGAHLKVKGCVPVGVGTGVIAFLVTRWIWRGPRR